MPQETYTARSDPRSGVQPVATIKPIDLGGLGQGLSEFGRGQAIAEKNAKRLLEQQNRKRDSLWVNNQQLQAQRHMQKYLIEASKNPNQDIVDTWENDWNKYTDELINSAPSEDAKDALSLGLGSLEVQMIPKVFGIKASADRLYADESVKGMFEAANDMIALNVSYDSLQVLKEQIGTAIDDMSGTLVDPATAAQYKEGINDLNLKAVDLWMLEDPSLARQVLKDTKGIPADTRAAYIKRIDAAEKQAKSVDRTLFERDYKSYISSVRATGKGSFDVEGYVSSLPSDRQVGVRTEIKDDIAVAQGYYNFSQAIIGKSSTDIDVELMKLKPEAGVEAYHRKARLYAEAAALAEQQKSLIKKDPFTAAMQSPVIEQMVSQIEDDSPAEVVQDTIAAAMQVQSEMGVPQGNMKVAPLSRLQSIAANLNKGSVDEVVNGINQLKSIYGQYYPDLFRNLVELPNDARVSTNLSMIHEHINGENTPPWVFNFIDATRQTTKDLGFTDEEANDFRETAKTQSFLNLQKAMFGAGGASSFERSGEVLEALSKYSMFLDASGETKGRGKSVKKASSQLIDSIYAFGESQGQTYGIPRQLPDMYVDDKLADKIDYALDATLNTKIQSKYAAVFGGDQGIPTPFHIGMVNWDQFGFSKDASADFKSKAVEDAIRTHGYWATAPDGNGVILMSKAAGTLRNQPVLSDQNEPIYVSFKEAMEWVDKVRAKTAAEQDAALGMWGP